MRRILLLAGAIVLVDTLFFAALTPLLPHYAHRLGLGKAGAGLLAAAYPLGALFGAIPSGIVPSAIRVETAVVTSEVKLDSREKEEWSWVWQLTQ